MTNLLKMIVIYVALLMQTTPTSAKMHFLPDYQESFIGRSNTDNSGRTSWKPGTICPNGWYTAAEIGDRICTEMGSYTGIGTCYSECKCNTSIYKYSGSDCTGSYSCSGSICDDGTIHYTNRTASCTWSGYTLTSCPTNANCTSSTCNNVTKYSITGCKTGWSGSDCATPTTCSSGYATSAANCGSVANGSYTLGSSSSGQSGSSVCYKCTISCNAGYTQSGNACVQGACNSGYYTSCPAPSNGTVTRDSCSGYSGNSQCCKYTISCNSGYIKSGSECGNVTCSQAGCSSGCATSVSGCGSVSNGTYSLGSSCGQSGSSTCYQCNLTCNTGYTKSGNTCVQSECSSGYYTSCPAPSNGTVTRGYCSGYSGNSQCCKYTISCNSGYIKSGSECGNVTCSQAGCSSGCATSVSGCGSVSNGTYSLGSSCGQSGSSTCYQCNLTCKTGWEGANCTTPITCPSGYATSASGCGTVANGQYILGTETCQSGGSTYKKCTISCNSGYQLNSAGTGCTPVSIECDEFQIAENGVCVDTRYVYPGRGYEPESYVKLIAEGKAAGYGKVCYDDDGDGILRAGDPDKIGTVCGDTDGDGISDTRDLDLSGYVYKFDDNAIYIVYGGGMHPARTNETDITNPLINLRVTLDTIKSLNAAQSSIFLTDLGLNTLGVAKGNYLKNCEDALLYTLLKNDGDTYDLLYPTPEVLNDLSDKIKYEGGTIMPLQLGATYVAFNNETSPGSLSHGMYLGKKPTSLNAYAIADKIGTLIDYRNVYIQNNGFFSDSYYVENNGTAPGAIAQSAAYNTLIHDAYIYNVYQYRNSALVNSIWPVHMYCIFKVSKRSCSFPAGYIHRTCPEHGVCASAPASTCPGFTRYKLTGCESGYVLNSDGTACVEGTTCDASYKLDACPTPGGICSECGGKFKHDGCEDGYTLGSSICYPCDFTGYPLDVCDDENGWCEEKYCGRITKYKITSCDDGWEIASSGEECEPAACPLGYDTYEAAGSNCPGSVANGEWVIEDTAEVNGKSGNEDCYLCQANCDAGYTRSISDPTKCERIASCPLGYATSGEVDTKCYEDFGEVINGWYELDTSDSNGKSGNETCYYCNMTCPDGWSLEDGNNCVNNCSGTVVEYCKGSWVSNNCYDENEYELGMCYEGNANIQLRIQTLGTSYGGSMNVTGIINLRNLSTGYSTGDIPMTYSTSTPSRPASIHIYANYSGGYRTTIASGLAGTYNIAIGPFKKDGNKACKIMGVSLMQYENSDLEEMADRVCEQGQNSTYPSEFANITMPCEIASSDVITISGSNTQWSENYFIDGSAWRVDIDLILDCNV